MILSFPSLLSAEIQKKTILNYFFGLISDCSDWTCVRTQRLVRVRRFKFSCRLTKNKNWNVFASSDPVENFNLMLHARYSSTKTRHRCALALATHAYSIIYSQLREKKKVRNIHGDCPRSARFCLLLERRRRLAGRAEAAAAAAAGGKVQLSLHNVHLARADGTASHEWRQRRG